MPADTVTFLCLLAQLHKKHEMAEGKNQLLFQENQGLYFVSGVPLLALGSPNPLSFCMVKPVKIIRISPLLNCSCLKKYHLVEAVF